MKNIAIINAFDGFGSTGKIASGLNSYLSSKKYNSFVCYAYRNSANKDSYKIGTALETKIHKALAWITGMEGFFSVFSTLRLLMRLKRKKVDTIVLLNIHHYYINHKLLFRFCKNNNIAILYLMIDEYPFLGKCCYNKECNHYLNGCGNCPEKKEYPRSYLFDTSKLIYDRKKCMYDMIEKIVFAAPEYVIIKGSKSPLLNGKKTFILDEAINTDFYQHRDTNHLRKKLGIAPDKIIIATVTPYPAERKGGQYFIQLARELEHDDRFVFVHVGNRDFKRTNYPPNYIAIGYVTDQEMLACYYSLGDLFLFPSLLDTMPNTCLEALSCGTPLLCFEISGMPYIADNTVATFVTPKSISELKQVVFNTPRKNNEIIARCRDYALSRYDSKVYYARIEDILKNIK